MERRYDPVRPVRVHCDTQPMPARLINPCAQLCFRVLLCADWPLKGEYSRGGTHLDPLCAMLDLIPNRLDHLIGAVSHARLWSSLQDAWCKSGQIAVSAGDRDDMPDRYDPGSVNPAGIGCVAQCNIDKSG